MPELRLDLGQRRALAQHAHRAGVTQAVEVDAAAQARTPRAEGRDAAAIWRRMLSGELVVRRHHDEDGRRYLYLEEPATDAEAQPPLTERERLVIELRDKLNPADLGSVAPSLAAGAATAAPAGENKIRDAVLALTALGYKAAEADKAVRQAWVALGASASTEALIKKALG